jgi:hypothetical protein
VVSFIPIYPRPLLTCRTVSLERLRIETPSTRGSLEERQPRARTPSPDALSYAESPQSAPYGRSPERVRASPLPKPSQELPPAPSPSAPHAHVQEEADAAQPPNAEDKIGNLLDRLFVLPKDGEQEGGQQEEPEANVASGATPTVKEKTRKRDRIKHFFGGKKDKKGKSPKP